MINLFNIHARHRIVEAAKRDKNGVLPSALVSWLAQRLDVSVARKSKLANQKHPRVFVDIPSHSLRRVSELCLA